MTHLGLADCDGCRENVARAGPAGGLILAHNMARPAPNPRYIEAITTNPELDSSFVLMDAAGLGMTLKKR